MWFAVNFFCVIYYFAGIAPIGYYGYYNNWGPFLVYFVYWLINFALLDYAKSKW